MLKTTLGLLLAFALGAACRWIDIPVPAPNRLAGALLVLAVTLGYLAADRVLSQPQRDPAQPRQVLAQPPQEGAQQQEQPAQAQEKEPPGGASSAGGQ